MKKTTAKKAPVKKSPSLTLVVKACSSLEYSDHECDAIAELHINSSLAERVKRLNQELSYLKIFLIEDRVNYSPDVTWHGYEVSENWGNILTVTKDMFSLSSELDQGPETVAIPCAVLAALSAGKTPRCGASKRIGDSLFYADNAKELRKLIKAYPVLAGVSLRLPKANVI